MERRGWEEGVMEKKTAHVSDNTFGAWVLLIIAIMGWVGMEVVEREHAGHSQEGLATQLDMPEHFLCARWEHC